MLHFENCEVSVNGTGLLAESAQIQTQNAVEPARIVGGKGVLSYSPNAALVNIFSFSYVVDVLREPCFATAKDLRSRHETYIYPFSQIVVGGVTGIGYLDSYSIQTNPNSLTKATASYLIYTPITGLYQNRKSSYQVNTDLHSGLHNNWTMYFNDDKESLSKEVLSFSYDFKANWQPVYRLGTHLPNQVQFLGGEESARLSHLTFENTSFSGEKIAEFENVAEFNPNWTQMAYIVSPTNNSGLSLDLSDSVVKSTNSQITVGNLAITEVNFSRAF